MLRRIHELKRHEEGQALVLAAITMLVLTLCIMATVNLTYAVHQKMELQDSADAVAYTTAAYQARALNFFAYTNRAMVVQYCSQMNLMATLTYLMFIVAVLTFLSFLPYVGIVFEFLANIGKVVLDILDVALAILIPAIDVVNYFTGLVQFAVSTDMAARIISGPQDELARVNSEGHHTYAMDDLASTLLNVDAGLRWEKTVLTSPIPTLAPPSDEESSFDRAMMTEIANGERQAITAYGSNNGSFPFRHVHYGFDVGVFGLDFDKSARTEWGSFGSKPGLGLGGIWQFLSDITTPTEQIYSIDDFKLTIKVLFIWKISFGFRATARADRQLFRTPHIALKPDGPNFCDGVPWYLMPACKAATEPFEVVMSQLLAAGLKAAMPQVDIPLLHFGMAPYARFRPGQTNWNRPSAKELFNQPPVLLLLTEPSSAIAAGGKPFMAKFAQPLSSFTSNSSKLMAESGNHFAPPPGGWRNNLDFQPQGLDMGGLMQDGFHAIAAAQAYYHRPGDWREPPNLFNPFWGAKLMPVVDYPLLANAPIIGPLLSQSYMVH